MDLYLLPAKQVNRKYSHISEKSFCVGIFLWRHFQNEI